MNKKILIRNKITNEEKEFKSYGELAKFFNVDQRRVSDWVNKVRVSLCMREYDRKYSYELIPVCNYNYFRVWSPEMAYFLGLIYADGNVKTQVSDTKNGNDFKHYVRISSIDRDVIEVFKKEINSDHKIQKQEKKQGKFIYVLEVGGDDMYQSMLDLGIEEAKTYKDCEVKLNPDYEDYFWTGYIDGDGSVTNDGKYLRIEVLFCAHNVKMIKRFEDWLTRLGIGINKEIIFREELNATVELFSYRIQRDLDMEILLNHTYLKSKVKINRKFNKIKKYRRLLP